MTTNQAISDISAINTLPALREWGRRNSYELSMLEDVDKVREAFANRMKELGGK